MSGVSDGLGEDDLDSKYIQSIPTEYMIPKNTVNPIHTDNIAKSLRAFILRFFV